VFLLDCFSALSILIPNPPRPFPCIVLITFPEFFCCMDTPWPHRPVLFLCCG
jgi:hypothetical protein